MSPKEKKRKLTKRTLLRIIGGIIGGSGFILMILAYCDLRILSHFPWESYVMFSGICLFSTGLIFLWASD